MEEKLIGDLFVNMEFTLYYTDGSGFITTVKAEQLEDGTYELRSEMQDVIVEGDSLSVSYLVTDTEVHRFENAEALLEWMYPE